MTTVILAMFLISLDRTIIGVAIPEITDEFNSVGDVGWYGSAFMLCQASSQLLFGRVYKHQSAKYTFLACVSLFEIGSAVCGAAPNSIALIFGRAIAGLGAGGIMSGGIQIMISIIPLNKRPMWQGLFGGIFGLGAAVGPLIGGALTSEVTWRWCFYINLPIGGATLVIIFFFMHLEADKKKKLNRISFKEQILQLDPIGAVFMFAFVICLVLALQLGGFTYPWSDGRIIALLTVFAVTFLCFVAWQWHVGPTAMVPLKNFTQRTFTAACVWSMLSYGGMTAMIYYLPIWFQVIKDSDALHSSYQNLPFILSLVIGSVLFGIVVRRSGHYVPSLIVTAILAPVGAGLISTFGLNTGHSEWIGYQVIYGFGIGHGMMGANMGVQSTFSDADLPVAMANVFFFQLMGAAIWLSVGENLFTTKLIDAVQGIPGVDPNTISSIGATDIRSVFGDDPTALQGVIVAYNTALKSVWYLVTGLSASLVLPLVFFKWVNVNKEAARRKEAKRIAAAEQESTKTAQEVEA
ncbi:MFS general substrate transporter [Microstroma glucosiphilum]|uniref:MFS general substrate transporter n=1 Tax=Pseudomicrostroma glucosiphilum TaxID=1684307 RepID=A0A316U900_9BASI|nr:MFS general substrate transporter [Pseudomicrostroma glucosiphilum]PWN21642.1 MFS general substrate transporter [Pseudomicrostroma glucosiphilum]